jgi:DNA-binding NarL/FixJ family response regulator
MSGEVIRVVIADDHPLFRTGVRALLELADDIEVVAEVGTTEEAVAAMDLQPDVVMMDLHMPSVGGVEATRMISHQSPQVAVLVLSMYGDSETIFAALRAGARGYLLKESGAAEVHRAVHAVASGEFITSPGVAPLITRFFASGHAAKPGDVFPTLTHREAEILDLIAQGKSNSTIARELFLSPKTVRNHISNIFTKIHFTDRADAIVRAREAGFGNRPRGVRGQTGTTP